MLKKNRNKYCLTSYPIMTDKKKTWQLGLAKTRRLFEALGMANAHWSEDDFMACEAALLSADIGAKDTAFIMDRLKKTTMREEPIRVALSKIIAELIRNLEPSLASNINPPKPRVILLSGINGAGKTTTIAKITFHFLAQNKTVILAAGDTFRAAAKEQLKHWGDHHAVRVVEQEGADPAAVAFDTIASAVANQTDIVLIDTAGRLPTQKHLMSELTRIHKVCAKALAGAPHEAWLVLDGTQGQNTLAQVKGFAETIPLTGLIVTKLDGTAKGGFIVPLAQMAKAGVFPHLIPIVFIGVGEKPTDIAPFNATDYAQSIVGE